MTDPDISAKAEELLAQAAALPTPAEVRDLAARAVAHGGTPKMSLDEIREIAVQAVDGLEKVTVLLRRLSQLATEPDPSRERAGGGQ